MSEKRLQERAARIFLDGADYIRTYGWQVEGMSRNGQPRCSMGALASAYPAKRWDKRLSALMYKALYQELGGINLTQYNHHFQDGSKVAALYERVAFRLKTR